MATLPLDLTGSLSSNLIRNEQKTITRDTDRYFVPANGAFYGDTNFRIYNNANGALLEPNTQYRFLHMVEEAVKSSYKNVYAVVHIVDKSITAVRFEYQAIGGVYQNIASVIDSKLQEYLIGTTGSNTIGAVAGVPVQVAPEHHLQSIKDFQGTGALVGMLEKIRQAVLIGNNPAFAAAYQYINERYSDAIVQLTARVNMALESVEEIEQRTQIQNGDYHITSNPANPSTYFGYGNWVLDTNVLLYGTGTGDDIGTFLNVGVGEDGHVAIRRYFWRRDDNASGASYQLTSSKTNVNEGDTVRVTLSTTGLSSGTKIAYKITGVTTNDLVSMPLNGEFTIAANGTAFIDIAVRQDMATEGLETMRVALSAMPNIYADILVNDTSLAPNYTIRFSSSANGSGEVSSVNEGDTVYIVLDTQGVAAGTRLYLLYNDSTVALADSASGSWPTQADLSEQLSAVIPVTIKADATTEGNETLVVNVCTTNNINSRVVRGVITVNDTSRSPTVSTRFASNSSGTSTITTINEGQTFYAVISVDNIVDGSIVDVIYSGTANAADFTTSLPTSVTISGSQAVIAYSLKNDVATEGDEAFIISTYFGGAKLNEASIIIKDTSLNPTYNLRFASDANGTDTISTVNEGSTTYLCLSTSNVANGKVYTVEYGGTSNAADITGTRPSALTITSNSASAALIIKADAATEGAETLIATVKDGTTIIGTATITINDTSSSPTATIRFSSNAAGSNTITSINEGQTAYAIIETTNINNAEVLQLVHGGSAVAADFSNARVNSVTVATNKASYELTLSNDLSTEGEETYNVTVTLPNGAKVTSGNLRIIDTSIPTLNTYFSASASGTGQITNINEGQTAYLVIETTGIATGGTVNAVFATTGTTVASDLVGKTIPGSAVITSARTIVPYSFVEDAREDGDKTISVAVTLSAGSIGSKTATLSIGDTSKFVTVAASGNITVPAGKVLRAFLIGPTAVSGVSADEQRSLGNVALTIGGDTYNLIGSGNGTNVTYWENGASVLDGYSTDVEGRTYNATYVEDEYSYLLDVKNAHTATPSVDDVNAGGLVHLIRVPNLGGNDTASANSVQFTKIGTTLRNHLNNLVRNFVGPIEYGSSGNSAYPGRAAGNALIAVVYINNGTTDVTLPLTIDTGSVTGGTRGTAPQCVYELHDTYAQADLGYNPVTILENATADNVTRSFTIEPNKRYMVSAISGGGYTSEAAQPGIRVGSVDLRLSNSASKIVIPGGAPHVLNTARTYTNVTVPGSLPTGVEKLSAIQGKILTNAINTTYDASRTSLNILTTHRLYPVLPIVVINYLPYLPIYGASGFFSGQVPAQAGNAVTFEVVNRGTTPITLFADMTAHDTALNADSGVTDVAGKGSRAAVFITEIVD